MRYPRYPQKPARNLREPTRETCAKPRERNPRETIRCGRGVLATLDNAVPGRTGGALPEADRRPRFAHLEIFHHLGGRTSQVLIKFTEIYGVFFIAQHERFP